MRFRFLPGLLLATALDLTPPARADNLDAALVKQAPALFMHCFQKQRYKNVGTLRFRVQLPGTKPAFDVEPLCSNLADRLENLLVLAGEPGRAPGVIHAATAAALARAPEAAYSTAAGRKLLFAGTYPLAL